MGGGGNLLNNVVKVATLGLSDKLGVTGDVPEVKTSAVEQVAEDRKSNTKKRKALYATQGGVLGQEVNQVGESSRGNLFGN